MHYGTLVILEEQPQDLEAAVAEAMAQGKEQYWDWFQIGGRWTGTLAPDYKPEEDPANIEVCDLCGGTGDRATHMGESKVNQHSSGCNGCLGKGKCPKWPTEWKKFPGDIVPVSKLEQKQVDKNFAYIVFDYGFFSSERYEPWAPDGKKFRKLQLPPVEWIKKEYPDGIAVVVDCHN